MEIKLHDANGCLIFFKKIIVPPEITAHMEGITLRIQPDQVGDFLLVDVCKGEKLMGNVLVHTHKEM